MVYSKAFTVGWEADKNPKLDFDLIQNHTRIYMILYFKLSLLYRTELNEKTIT